ncbi:MAG: hypothetical protein AAGA48_41050, partial [Myxococcota bacterium]
MDLRLLRSAVELEAWAEALERALVLWQVSRHPELVPVILHASTEALRTFAEPRARTRHDFDAAWRRLALDDAGSVATGWLANHLSTKVPEVDPPGGNYTERGFARTRHAALLLRLATLTARTPDPRVARAGLALLERGRLGAWDEDQTRDLYRPVLQMIERAGDPTIGPSLERIARQPPSRRASARTVLRADLPSSIARLSKVAPHGTLDPEGLEAVAPQPRRQTTSGGDIAGLLAQVWANPWDASLREVLGDAWLDQGGPQAELLLLERAGAATDDKRMVRIIRKHAAALMGADLASVLLKPKFRGGLLDAATVRATQAASSEVWQRAPGAEELSTLRVLRQGRASGVRYATLALSSRARSLEQVDVDRSEFLIALSEGPRRPLKGLRFLDMPSYEDILLVLASASLDEVTAIDVPCLHGSWLHMFRRTEWRDRLESLAVAPSLDWLGHTGDPLFHQVGALIRWFPNLRRLAVHDEYNVSPILQREADGW